MLLGYRASPDFTDALIHLTTQEASIEGTLIQKIHPNKEIKGKKLRQRKTVMKMFLLLQWSAQEF